jgi:D-serine deaminase-like pyridoxal phosphate-dependent protein
MTFIQTTTPLPHSYLAQWKATLVKDMVGKKLNEIRTPMLVIDKSILERNCIQLGKISTDLDTKVRIHVKTHKVILKRISSLYLERLYDI